MPDTGSSPTLIEGTNTAVLVLGARSELGRHLLPQLERQGFSVLATSRAPDLDDHPGTWIKADPVNGREAFVASLRDALQGRSLGAMINLLGSWMRGEPRKVLVETSQWLATALESVAEPGTPAIYVSGTAVYGHRPNEVVTESAEVAPNSKMGAWLVEGEQVWMNHPHWKASVVRFPHLYGRADDRVMRLMARGEFFVPGNGDNRMPHLHWKDAANAVAAAVRAPAGIYHWADRSRSTLRQWCNHITASMGVEPLPSYLLEEALACGAAEVLGPHMTDPALVAELFAVMTADLELDTTATEKALELDLVHPDPFESLTTLLHS